MTVAEAVLAYRANARHRLDFEGCADSAHIRSLHILHVFDFLDTVRDYYYC